MIESIQIHNFKSIGNLEVQLDPLTVLIGRSGSGKTNFVEAVRFWRDHLASRKWSIGDWRKVLSATLADKGFGLKIIFRVPDFPIPLTYLLSYQFTQQSPHVPLLAEESLSNGDRLVFHQRGNQWVLKPPVLDAPQPGQLALGLLYGVREDKLAYLSLTRGIGCYDFPGTVLQAPRLQNAHNRASLVGLADNGENYLDAFESITDDLLNAGRLDDMVAALKTLSPSVSTIEMETRQHSHIIVAHEVAGVALPLALEQQSEGFRRFLAHLIALYQVPARPIVFFEEPDKGIFPAALATLADYFTASAKKSQIVLTTHSPQLLDHFPVEAIRVVEMRDYQTHIGIVSREQKEAVRQSLLTTGELLTVDPARIAEPEHAASIFK